MPLCLATGAVLVTLPVSTFALSWTHSVERTLWREHWRVAGETLILDEAEVAGSGAGMEPPAGARLEGGSWRYRPSLPPLQRLRLAHSEFASDYSLCWRDKCELLATLVDQEQTAVELFPCGATQHSATTASDAAPSAASADAREVTR